MKPMCRIQQRWLSRISVLSALLVALSRSGAAVLDSTFIPAADGPIFAVAVQADGRILVGGDFTNLGGQTRNSIGRLNVDGTLDTTFNPGVSGDGFAVVYSLAVQSDGKILVGGDFTTLGGQSRSSIGRLNPDGAVDIGFNPGIGGDFPSVFSLAFQADGKILVGGAFTTLAAQTRNYVGRLNTNGTLDTTFNPNADWIVGSFAVQADGRIVLGGSFSTVGGLPRAGIARLNATGSLDSTFNPGVGGDVDAGVYCLALQADGKILVGGSFETLGGQSRNNVGRLNTNGTLDTFNLGADEFVESLAVQTDGKILLGGYFTALAGQSRTHLGRVNADGSLDGTFNPVVTGSDFTSVSSLAVQPNGKVLMVGGFTNVNGQTRLNLARLDPADAATQSLTYAGTTITWLRGGTSPEVVRTTFDHGSNGVAWTSLGAGTRIAGGWQKTSATVPAGRTIRARGYTAGGGGNSWFVETYFGKPVFIDQPASRTNNFGTTARFEVSGVGSDPINFRWLRNGVPLNDQGNITGATNRMLTLSQVANADEGGYSVALSNAFGSVTSAVATLTVNDPSITVQPLGAVRSAGGSVTFSVTATGTPTLSYQWYRETAALAGATGSSLTLSNLTVGDAGQYSVVVSNPGGSAASLPALLTVNGATADGLFNPGANAAVFALAIQPDGKILVGGAFTSMNGASRNCIARLNADGTLDPNFNPGAEGGGFFGTRVYGLAVQTDGKILVAGDFTSLAGQSRYRLGRLEANGTLDATFNPAVASFVDLFTEVEALALQADGKILIGGVFDTIAGVERINIGRLNANGTADSFNPGLTYFDNSQDVHCLAVQADGKVLVGGAFTELGGQGRTNFGRVTTTGALDTAFNPMVSGEVTSVAVQADGKILIGGGFSSVGGQSRICIARLNTNGTPDTAFNPGASSAVNSIAVQADGKILVGGGFTTIGGQTRNRIARLSPDGTLDGTFNPGANSSVHALAVLPDGKILAGGNFSSLGSQAHLCLGRLNNTSAATQSLTYASSTITWLRGGAAPEFWRTTFDHSADGVAWTSIGAGTRISNGWQRTGFSLPAGRTIRARGAVAGGYRNAAAWFVDGYFGKPIVITHPLSRTNGGTTTATFQVAVGGAEPMTIQWQKNGTNLANLGNISGATSNFLTLANVLTADAGDYRVVASNSFGSTTSLVAHLTVFNPMVTTPPANASRNAGESVTLTVTSVGTPPLSYQWYRNGNLLPGATGASLFLSNLTQTDAGAYTVVVSNGEGSYTSSPAWLTVNMVTLDSAFNPQPWSAPLPLAVQPDGKILIGGSFYRNGNYSIIERFNASGSFADGFANDEPFSSYPMSGLAVQPDGKILVCGGFPTLASQIHAAIGRLNADLSLDNTFTAGAGQPADITDLPEIYAMAVQADGKILVGGYFTTLSGSSRNNIGRFNSNGTLDTMNPGANDDVYALAVQADGKILVGGRFSTLGGSTRVGIGRLNAVGTLDTTFNPGVDKPVSTLSVQADGKILVGGFFTLLGGQARNCIGRLNTNGTVDATFNPDANNGVSSIVVQADGRILVAGSFTTIGGQTRNRIARLNPDGTLDPIFHPGADAAISGVGLQPDGKILLGGSFSNVGGQPREYFARLNNPNPATELLNYGSSTITWLRGGASPEVWRTTFERSTNGLNWTSLGSGSRIAGGWQLTGVPSLTNGILRARGHLTGGYRNASAWFAESTLDLARSIRLNLTRNGNSLLLNWTGAQPPYQVQQSTNAGNPNAWQNVGAPVQTNSMTLPISPGYQFLRVRTQ